MSKDINQIIDNIGRLSDELSIIVDELNGLEASRKDEVYGDAVFGTTGLYPGHLADMAAELDGLEPLSVDNDLDQLNRRLSDLEDTVLVLQREQTEQGYRELVRKQHAEVWAKYVSEHTESPSKRCSEVDQGGSTIPACDSFYLDNITWPSNKPCTDDDCEGNI